MNFFKLLDKLKRKQASLILYCLLDRIPIIVFGDDSNQIDDLLLELSELIDFRKEMVFYTDFISNNEYINLIQNEDIDYNTQRIQIRCPDEVSFEALNQFENFRSWLLGINIIKQKDNLLSIKNVIKKKIGIFLNIYIT